MAGVDRAPGRALQRGREERSMGTKAVSRLAS
jgi:hypothetical protein